MRAMPSPCSRSAALLIAFAALGCGGDGDGSGATGGGSSTTGSSTATGGGGGGTTSTSTTGGGGGAGGSGTGGAGGLAPCEAVAGATYGTLVTVGPPPVDPPAAAHPDINVKMRGWAPAGGALALVDYGGDTDVLAPRLFSVFPDDHVPAFVQNHAVHDWDWANMVPGGPIAAWEVTMISFASTPGEVLELPRSGYDIGQGFGARVLFVDEDSMTLKYTGEDDVVYGYTIHLVGICPEPSLRALYDATNAAGRTELPALAGDQPLGRARTGSFQIAIRDTGAFMDPRSQKDWW